MNIPNFITLLRILLVPLLVIFIVERQTDLALLVFILAGAGDALDGFLARILKQQTEIGAFIDPIADKLLISAASITLAVQKIMPAWLAIVIVSRDIIILGGIAVLIINNNSPAIKPTYLSKLTTFVLLVTILFFLGQSFVTPFLYLEKYLVTLAVLLTILSGFHYVYLGFKLLDNQEGTERK